jgi:peroxiredoxin
MGKVMIRMLVLVIMIFINEAQVIAQTFFFPAVTSFKLLDVNQQRDIAITTGDMPLTLFVFLSPECPLCQNYSKTLKEIRLQYHREVRLYGIIPGKAYSAKEVVAFEKKYNTGFTLLIDKNKQLAKYLNATVTPQAILLNNRLQLVYSGAIDDWAIAPGKKRLKASKYYLEDAIEQSLKLLPVAIAKTNPVGCKINDY